MAKQILVVDDEERIRQSLNGILKDEGYEVLEAKDGLQALKQIESDPPELVLLDIWMPGMDGMEVLERMKGQIPNLPVIMISGHGNIELAVKAVRRFCSPSTMPSYFLSWSRRTGRFARRSRESMRSWATPRRSSS